MLLLGREPVKREFRRLHQLLLLLLIGLGWTMPAGPPQGWILKLLGFYTTGGLLPSILVAIFGAVVLIAFVRMLKRA